MPKIISISRRGDIPALYTPWLMKRIREGFCHFKAPYRGNIFHVSLKPEECTGIVFWTRNPSPLFKHFYELRDRGHHFYFHFTINGYPSPIETNTPSLFKSIDRLQKLSKKIGVERVHWRYDPIILSKMTPEIFHIKNFSIIAKNLRGSTGICTISFMQFYEKSRNNFTHLEEKHGVQIDKPSLERKIKLSKVLKQIALENGIKLRSCCDNSLLAAGIQGGSCIGPEYLSLMRPGFLGDWKKKPTRAGCKCFESIDIGAYETCIFGCSYCYATRNRKMGLRHLKGHDKNDTILIKPLKVGPQDAFI